MFLTDIAAAARRQDSRDYLRGWSEMATAINRQPVTVSTEELMRELYRADTSRNSPHYWAVVGMADALADAAGYDGISGEHSPCGQRPGSFDPAELEEPEPDWLAEEVRDDWRSLGLGPDR